MIFNSRQKIEKTDRAFTLFQNSGRMWTWNFNSPPQARVAVWNPELSVGKQVRQGQLHDLWSPV